MDLKGVKNVIDKRFDLLEWAFPEGIERERKGTPVGFKFPLQ